MVVAVWVNRAASASRRGPAGGIDADGDEQRAQFEIAFRQLFIGHQDPRRLAGLTDLLDGIFNGGLHFRVLRIAAVAHISAEIRRADKHTIYPVDIEDLRQIFSASRVSICTRTHMASLARWI